MIAALTLAIAAPASLASSGAVAWGLNSNGQLGNGNLESSNVPVAVTGLSGVTALAGGEYHSLAALSNGAAKAWGYNGYGELGNGTNTESNVPVAVSGLSEVTAVSAGTYHSLALLKNGTVTAWGYGYDGELGNGTNEVSNVPVAVSGLSEVTAIAAGWGGYGLALLKNGTVKSWGYNALGSLGNGTNESSNVPVAVSGLSEVTAISAGYYHSLALLKNGTVMSWGYNPYGQLGNGTNTDSNVPVAVSGLSEVTAIAGGYFHSLALLKNGTVTSWGYNGYGQLGNSTNTDSNVPVAVSGLSEVTAISGGGYHSLALRKTGAVMDWGSGGNGELGNGSFESSNVPVAVSGLSGTTATIIAGGGNDSLAYSQLPPAPTVTKLKPTSGPFYGGTTVTITGTNLTASSVKFGSFPATSVKVISATSITAVSPYEAVGTVDVRVTTSGGVSAISSKDKFKFTPTVTSVTPNTGSKVGGTVVTVEGQGFVEGKTGTSIKFGTAKGTGVECVSTTSCTVVAPAHAVGKVDVTATVNKVSSPKVAADKFTYS